MATLDTKHPTLADIASRLDPNDDRIAAVIEVLGQKNQMLEDMVWVEGNLPTGHMTVVRTGLPEVTWRKLNYGVQPSKSRTAKVTDTCGMLEAYAEVDKKIADLNGNTNAWKLSEHSAFLEAMSQALGSAVIYGDATADPEKITGLSPRYAASSADETLIGSQILKGGGAGSTNTSVWLVCWGENTIHGIYPKGSKAGLQMEDKGQVTLQDADGGNYEGYRTHYQWDCGLTVRDWRYAVRVANIDVAALTKNAATGADLIDLMVQAIELLPDTMSGRPAFYCNRTVRSFLRRQILNKSNVNLSWGEVSGKKALMFDEIPVRRVDKILSTEAAVA